MHGTRSVESAGSGLVLNKYRITEGHTALEATAAEFKHFFRWCEANNHHLAALWHKLDKNSNMSLHKMEFVSGLKELNYDGDTEKLWSHIDRDHTQTISFFEFAPEHALELSCFKLWAGQRFGSLQGSFASMDANRDGRITFSEFKRGCLDNGLPEQLIPTINTLFLMVDSEEQCKGTITKGELAYVDNWESPGFLAESPDFVGREALKKALTQRHHKSPLVVFRKDIDKDNSMRVNFGEFSNFCKKMARAGMREAEPDCGITAVFCAFDQERTGWFSLREWDADSYKILFTFSSWAKKNFQRVTAFVRSLLLGRSIHIDFNTFARATKGAGLRSADLPDLFDALCRKKGSLSVADVAFLDRWDPEQEQQERVVWDHVVQKRFANCFGDTMWSRRHM